MSIKMWLKWVPEYSIMWLNWEFLDRGSNFVCNASIFGGHASASFSVNL